MSALYVSKFDLDATDKGLLCLAFVLFFFSTYSLYHSGSRIGFEPSGAELGTLTTKGKVRRRHAKTLHWESIEGASKVYLRDIVYTPKSSSAEFRWGENKFLRLEPDSMVQFDEIVLDKIAIQLIEGKVKEDAITKSAVVVKKEEKAIRLIPYPKITKFRTTLPNIEILQNRVSELEQRLKQALSKPVALLPTRPVPPSRVVALGLGSYELQLISPQNEIFNLAKNKWLKLNWRTLPFRNVTYQLEVSRDKSFTRFVSHKTKRESLSIQFEDPGRYYWRVQAENEVENTSSQVSSFTMALNGGRDSPMPREIANDNAQYTFEVSNNIDFTTVIRSGVARTPHCELTGLRLGNYFCRIKDKKTGRLIGVSPVRIP